MKLLLEENTIMSGEYLNFNLMLEDEPDNIKYVLYVYLDKSTKIKCTAIAKNIKSVISEYFLGKSQYKKALYVPKEHRIDVSGDGYIDVYYDKEFKNVQLDEGYELKCGNISKNLMSIELDNTGREEDVLKIEFKSLFLVDEDYNMQTLWEVNNGRVYDFLLAEILKAL